MALATGVRLAWVMVVPTVPVSDFAMYRESANYLSEFGRLDPGFIYMPGFVALLAWVKDAGGDLLAQKLLGVGFGGLGAAGLFLVSRALLDQTRARKHVEHSEDVEAVKDVKDVKDGGRNRRLCPYPYAVATTLLYALWPAGVAMASVVGTDVPAAALLVTAIGLLVTLARRRPLGAAVAFGATMGLAAWVRAVALPLSVLALGPWLALSPAIGSRSRRLARAAAYTAVGVGVTFLVLLPWGVRHHRQSGELYFTDDHGGITALIGANPNSEGTYTRALNRLFKDVSGRSVLDEPHRQTDRAAYAMAREWMRFEPRYALGLAVDKADRLFDPEHRLLYWPIFRPGVLRGGRAAFFARHRDAIVGLADGFGLAVAGLALVGVALAVAHRRSALLSLVPFSVALCATYTIFFAEPRYRLPIEMLAFPFVALALGELARAASARRDLLGAARLLGPALLMVVAWRASWPALIEWGRTARARHRWAVTEVELDGRTRTLLWGRAVPDASPGISPISGAPNGVHLQIGGEASPRVRLELGGGPLPAGRYLFHVRVAAPDGGPARLELAGPGVVGAQVVDLGAGGETTLETAIAHPGGPLRLEGTLASPVLSSLWVSEAAVTTLR